MSCHFVFREAWLINFNRWFLLAFTHPYSGLCFFFFNFSFYARFSLFLLFLPVMETELLIYIKLKLWLGNDCGKLQRKRKNINTESWWSNVQQCCKSVHTNLILMQIFTCVGSGLAGTEKGHSVIYSRHRLSYREQAQSWQPWPFGWSLFFQTCLVRLMWSEEI